MDKSYLWSVIKNSWTELWHFTKGQIMVGLVLTIITFAQIAISWPFNFEAFWGNMKRAGFEGNLLYLLLAVAIVLVVMFLYYALLKVPRKLYLTEKAEKEKLQTKLYELSGEKESDTQSLNYGIDYVLNHTEFGRQKTWGEVFQDLERFAIGSRITIRGRLKNNYSEFASEWSSEIPSDFLDHCIYKYHGDQKTLALVEQPESDEKEKGQNLLSSLLSKRGMRIYYEPTISMVEIRKIFDD